LTVKKNVIFAARADDKLGHKRGVHARGNQDEFRGFSQIRTPP